MPPDLDTPPQTEADPAQRFTSFLHGLSKRAPSDGTARAHLARLRRTLERRGVDLLAYREVGDHLPAGLSRDKQETYLLVAALYAIHAAKSGTPWSGDFVSKASNFGASCGRLRGGSGSMDLRFAALLDARREDLPYRLRQAVALLAASKNDVGVRYDLLLRDLLRWDAPGRPVQRAWAEAYWTPRAHASSTS